MTSYNNKRRDPIASKLTIEIMQSSIADQSQGNHYLDVQQTLDSLWEYNDDPIWVRCRLHGDEATLTTFRNYRNGRSTCKCCVCESIPNRQLRAWEARKTATEKILEEKIAEKKKGLPQILFSPIISNKDFKTARARLEEFAAEFEAKFPQAVVDIPKTLASGWSNNKDRIYTT